MDHVLDALQIAAAGLTAAMMYYVITNRKVVEIDDAPPPPTQKWDISFLSARQLAAGKRGELDYELRLRKQKAPQTLV